MTSPSFSLPSLSPSHPRSHFPREKPSLTPLSALTLGDLTMLQRTVLSKSIHLRRYSQSAAAAIFHDAEGEVFPQPDPKYAETIVAIPRLSSGKSIAAKERKVGRVPSIIFEQEDGQHGGNKRLISVQANQIRKLVNHLGRSFFLSRLFDLEVRADVLDPEDIVEKVRVLPRLVLSFFSFFLSFLCLLRAVFGSLRESLGKWEKFQKFARLFSGISPFRESGREKQIANNALAKSNY